MAHILEQTLATKPSHESFHSTHSQQATSSALSSPLNQLNTDLHTAALHAAGVPVVSIEHYLNDPRYQGPEASPPVNSSLPKSKKTPNYASPAEPVQLGAPKTSHHVPMLYQLCQERGLVAEFEIDGEQFGGFCGSVTVGQEVFSSEKRWPNKKEAKEALAELAVPAAREMGGVGREKNAATAGGEQEKNWIGTLQEYHNSLDPTHTSPGPAYTEYALGLHFACTCTFHTPTTSTITDTPTPSSSSPTTFGSPTIPFTTKKAARNNAAKEAVRHLISTNALNADGTVKPRKKSPANNNVGPTVRIENQQGVGVVEIQKSASVPTRVNDLALLLGLQPPTYRFSPASPATPSMLTGGAHFAGDAGMGNVHPRLVGAVGEVRNVFGKKHAKEECAKAVWEVLRAVARERGVEVPAE